MPHRSTMNFHALFCLTLELGFGAAGLRQDLRDFVLIIAALNEALTVAPKQSQNRVAKVQGQKKTRRLAQCLD